MAFGASVVYSVGEAVVPEPEFVITRNLNSEERIVTVVKERSLTQSLRRRQKMKPAT